VPNDYARYGTDAISPTMEAFADFLIAEVYGGELPADLDETTFRRAVSLGGSTRMYFQKSDTWKNDPRNYLANVEANRAAKLAEKTERAAETARKAAERAEALRAKLAEAVEAAEAKAAALAPVAEEPVAEEPVAEEPVAEEGAPKRSRRRAA
jgi:hypothetical protein